MWKNFFCACVLIGFFLPATLPVQADPSYPYAYEFVSSNPNISGELFLDAPASDTGSASDIGPESYLSFNLYNGYIPPVTFYLSNLNTFLDPGFSLTWNASQVTSTLDIAIGIGQNTVLLSREYQDPSDTSPTSPEYDTIIYDTIFLGSDQNVVNGQPLTSSVVSLIASESTVDVGGGGIDYNIPFYPGSSSQWIALAVVPEPSQVALVAGFGGLVTAWVVGSLRSGGPTKRFLRNLLCRVPPHRE